MLLVSGLRVGRFLILVDQDGRRHAVPVSAILGIHDSGAPDQSIIGLPAGRCAVLSEPMERVLHWLELWPDPVDADETLHSGMKLGRFVVLVDRNGLRHAVVLSSILGIHDTEDQECVISLPGGRCPVMAESLERILSYLGLEPHNARRSDEPAPPPDITAARFAAGSGDFSILPEGTGAESTC
jgi:hypothetical protein